MTVLLVVLSSIARHRDWIRAIANTYTRYCKELDIMWDGRTVIILAYKLTFLRFHKNTLFFDAFLRMAKTKRFCEYIIFFKRDAIIRSERR